MNAKPYKTPTGLELAHLNKVETEFVYNEMFVEKVYLRHGITLKEGDTVLDIGANIGMFTVYLQEHYKNLKVYAFEPSPEIFAALRQNAAKYGDAVKLFKCGISGETRDATFTFYPSYSILSGFHGDSATDSAMMQAGVLNQWREKYPSEPDPDHRFIEALAAGALKGKVEYSCRLRNLSEVIRETGIADISLLKIDAERSEFDILSGIAAEHWPIIRQIAMEIHGADPLEVPRIKTILEHQAFSCAIEEEKHFESSGIVNLYARRE